MALDQNDFEVIHDPSKASDSDFELVSPPRPLGPPPVPASRWLEPSAEEPPTIPTRSETNDPEQMGREAAVRQQQIAARSKFNAEHGVTEIPAFEGPDVAAGKTIQATVRPIQAGIQDLGETMAGRPTMRNMVSVSENSPGAPTPFERETAGVGGWQGGLAQVAQSVPDVAVRGAVGGVLGPVAGRAAVPLTFGAQPEGFDPKSAAVVAAFGFGSALAGEWGAKLIKAGIIPEGAGLAQKVVEVAGGQIAGNIAQLTADLPELSKLSPEERKGRIADTIFGNLAFALLEAPRFARGVPSHAQEILHKDAGYMADRINDHLMEQWANEKARAASLPSQDDFELVKPQPQEANAPQPVSVNVNQHQGVPPGENLQPNPVEVRQGQGEQTGGSSGVRNAPAAVPGTGEAAPPSIEAEPVRGLSQATEAQAESGWTLNPAPQSGGVNLAGLPPELAAKMPKQWEFTDRRPESPTKGFTIYVPENASKEAILGAMRAKADQEMAASQESGNGEEPKTETSVDPSFRQPVPYPVSKLKLSADVPQFKKNANKKTGETEGGIKGPFSPAGVGPIGVWERLNGDSEVITGRNRFASAQRSGVKHILADVFKESEGFTKEHGIVHDAFTNIKDGQGTLEDYATFFRHFKNINRERAESEGLLGRAKGVAGWDLGRNASNDLFALYVADKISEKAALAIARAAPGEDELQQVGIRAALTGADPEFIRGRIESARNSAEQAKPASQSDFFTGTSLEQVWDKQADVIAKHRRDLTETIAARNAILKRFEAATSTGSISADKARAIDEVTKAKAELDRWAEWPKHPDLKAIVEGGDTHGQTESKIESKTSEKEKEGVLTPESAPVKIMGVASKVRAQTDVGGVRYELFEGTKNKKAAIRVTDESGNVVTLKQYPSVDAAEAEYKTTVDAATKAEQPAPKAKEPIDELRELQAKPDKTAVDRARIHEIEKELGQGDLLDVETKAPEAIDEEKKAAAEKAEVAKRIAKPLQAGDLEIQGDMLGGGADDLFKLDLGQQTAKPGRIQLPPEASGQGLEAIRKLVDDPKANLSPASRQVMHALLDKPVMRELDWSNLRVAVYRQLDRARGSANVGHGLIYLSQEQMLPSTFPHEVAHFLYEMLPEHYRQAIEGYRLKAINKWFDELTKTVPDIPPAVKYMLHALADGATSDRFVAHLDEVRKEVGDDAADIMVKTYPLSSGSEFLAGFVGDKFAKSTFDIRNASAFDKFKAKLSEWWEGIVRAVRSVMGREPSMNHIYNDLLDGKYLNTVDGGQKFERQLAIDETKPGEDETKKPKFEPTQVMGQTEFVRSREHLTPESRDESLKVAKKLFDAAGIPVTPDEEMGGWRITNDGFEHNIEGRKLAEMLEKEIGSQNRPGKSADHLASILNSIVLNFEHGTMDQVFDQGVRNRLFDVSQSERSYRGALLGSLAQFGKSVEFVARNVDVMLHRLYSDAFGGAGIKSFMDRIVKHYRNLFTEGEFKNALDGHQEMNAILSRLSALNRMDEGGRVYRRVQGLLKPKGEKPLSMLEADARVQEAVDEILQQAKKQGLEPIKSPNKPLSPLYRLVHLMTPENAKKVTALLGQAVQDAEHNAGVKATLARLPESERDEMQGRFEAGEEPEHDAIEEGLNLPEFAHWKKIRDNLLGYSPVTVKLAESLVKNDFKGARFSKGNNRVPADTRIDLNALAKHPDDEIRRVLDSYLNNIEANMSLTGANGATKQRVRALIESKVVEQIQARRQEMIDKLFNSKAPVKTTALERLQKIINIGAVDDPLFETLAAESTLQNLTPKMGELIKQTFETPFYRQSELKQVFQDTMMKQVDVDPEQADKLWDTFGKAYDAKLEVARQKALEQARASLSPSEKEANIEGRSVWQIVERAVNAGMMDSGEILRDIAKKNGYEPPTDAQVAKMKFLSEAEQKMRDLTTAEREGMTPAEIEKEIARKAAITEGPRARLKSEMAVMWAKMTRPIKFLFQEGYVHNRSNFAAAANELSAANLLLKLGFATRQVIGVASQGLIYTPTRAIAQAFINHFDAKGRGEKTNLLSEIGTSLKDGYTQRAAAARATFYAIRGSAFGRAEERNVERLMSGIAALDRLSARADQYAQQGDHGRATIFHLLSMQKLGFRVAQALDNMQGVPAKYQEMRYLVKRELRANGKTEGEAEQSADFVIGDMKSQWLKAIEEIQSRAIPGWTPKIGEIKEAAWNLVKRWQHERMQELELPADDFEKRMELLRNTIGYNERETTGLGGGIATGVKALSNTFEQAGVPLLFGRFGNAIGITINRALAFTPAYWIDMASKHPSGWRATETDRMQRHIEGIGGSAVGAIAAGLVLAGIFKVQRQWPSNEADRELFERQGHRPGTVEIPVPGGFIALSLNNSPITPLAPYLAGAGALVDLMEKRAKQQQVLNEQAAKRGVAPQKIKPMDLADFGGIAASAAYQSALGGRTASGLLGSITDHGIPNVSKLAAAQVSAFVPGLPALQEVSRMMGVNLDTRMATFWDFMLPLPTSGAAKVNMLGDPVGNPNAIQRIAQVLTGGSYPYVTSDTQSEAGYAALFGSGYRPPSVNPGRGYNVNGEMRPLTTQESEQYTVTRGELFKQKLAVLGPNADRNQVKQAFAQANTEALATVGAAPVASSTTAARSAGTASRAAATVRGRIGRSVKRGVIGSSRAALRRGGLPKVSGIRQPRLSRR